MTLKKIGIIGASGYTGHELIKILKNHKSVEIKVLNSRSFAGKKVSELYPDYTGDEVYTDYSNDEINKMGLSLVFLALPNGLAMQTIPALDKKIKIVDLSADYRFKDLKKFEEVYGIKPTYEKNKAVYGLPELFRDKIKKSKLTANPGCYVTASILGTFPIQKYAKYIVLDCKSGWSGAGKESEYAKDENIIKDNIVPYKLTKHRHKYEIEQFIKTKLSFTPHVIDTFQGMMCTSHILLKKDIKKEEIIEMYKEFYKDSPFVKIIDGIPQIKHTQKTNHCHIGGFEIDENNQLVIISTIDNLIKGASGQAVQNMNLMLGFEENEGLI